MVALTVEIPRSAFPSWTREFRHEVRRPVDVRGHRQRRSERFVPLETGSNRVVRTLGPFDRTAPLFDERLLDDWKQQFEVENGGDGFVRQHANHVLPCGVLRDISSALRSRITKSAVATGMTVVVIGGGIVGLARRGEEVVVCEKGTVGSNTERS